MTNSPFLNSYTPFSSTSTSNIDIVKYIIRQVNNINSLFVDYIFVTGDESAYNEIEQYIDELYSKKSVIFNIPIVRYDKNCPSDTIYWFREGLDLPMKNLDNFFGDMRDATKEEQKKVNSYIDSISEDTGLNFWDIVDGKFVDENGVYEFKNGEFVKVK